MAFSLGYASLCDRDIQHLYTSFEIKPPPKRRARKYEPVFLEELDSERHQRSLNRRFMEYIPKWEIELPRAPAFRTLDSRYIKRVVKRLTHPKKYDHTQWCDSKTMSRKDFDWLQVEEERKEKMRNTLKEFARQKIKTDQPIEKHEKSKHHGRLPAVAGLKHLNY